MAQKRATKEYVREDEKKHSVRYVESGASSDPELLGTIYVRRESGLTHAKRLLVTIEEIEVPA